MDVIKRADQNEEMVSDNATLNEILKSINIIKQENNENISSLKKVFLAKYESMYNETGVLRATIDQQKNKIDALNEQILSLELKNRINQNISGNVTVLSNDEIGSLVRSNEYLSQQIKISHETINQQQVEIAGFQARIRELERGIWKIEQERDQLKKKVATNMEELARFSKEKDNIAISSQSLAKENQRNVAILNDYGKKILDLSRALEQELNQEVKILKEFNTIDQASTKLEAKYEILSGSPLGRLNLFIWKVFNKIKSSRPSR